MMDLNNILETLQKYSISYMRYVLSISDRGRFAKRSDDFDGNLVIFSLISTLVGGYLYGKFIQNEEMTQRSFLSTTVREYSSWLFIAGLLYFLLNIRAGTRSTFTNSISIVLRVLPVIFVVCAYTAEIISQIALLFENDGCAPWWGYAGFTLVQFVLIVAFFPISVSKDAQVGWLKSAVVTAMVILVISALQGFVLVQRTMNNAIKTSNDPAKQEQVSDALKTLPAKDRARLKACNTSQTCQDDVKQHLYFNYEWGQIGQCLGI